MKRTRALLGLFICLARLWAGPELAGGDGLAYVGAGGGAEPVFNPYSAIPPPPRDVIFYDAIVDELQSVYAAARPFKHVIADGMFPPDLVRAVAAEYPYLDENTATLPPGYSISHLRVQYNKIETSQIRPATRFLMDHMKSRAFVNFLQKITGIPALVPDPTDYGAGPHQIVRGGLLKIHLDFNFNERINLWRRVNVLFYLNEGWKEEWGGKLELWSADMQAREGSVEPLFNRMVIFAATEQSFHGHPDPLQCPHNVTRKSVAMYYYTQKAEGEEAEGREGWEGQTGAQTGGQGDRGLQAGKRGVQAGTGRGQGLSRTPRQTDYRPRAEDSFSKATMYQQV